MLPKAYNRYFSKVVVYAGLFLLSFITATYADGLIPCDGPDCTVDSVIQLINNIMNFFFHTLLVPIFVLALMYLGWGYLTAEGNPSQHAKLKTTMKHMFTGLLLMLCAWLIVKTLLVVLGYSDSFHFFS